MKAKRILSLLIGIIMLVTMMSVGINADEPVTEFFASFETSEITPLIENNVIDSSGLVSALTTARSAGAPASADPIYGNGSRGWDGTRVLKVTGTFPASGRGYSTNLIYDNLNIAVAPNTQLSYVILPDYSAYTSFDWEFTSQYISLDLEFTDGTRLSTLGGVDQYGIKMTGNDQGSGKQLYSKQWNLVKSNIGEVATGKTIKKVFLNYDKPSNKTGKNLNITAYLDCLSIKPADIAPKATPVEYANIFVGNNDKGLYSRGLQWPAVMTPNGFNCWCPSNVPVTTWLGSSYTNYKIFAPIPDAGITHITASHQASLWIGDYGTFQFMPNVSYNPASTTLLAAANRRTLYDKESMIANPAYFSVDFTKAANAPAKGVKLEMSPTEHAMMTRMTFPADSQYVNVILDSYYITSGGSIVFDGNTFKASSSHNSNGEGRGRKMYIYGEFDKTPTATKRYSATNANPSSMVTFATGTTEVNLKMATSFISVDQAKKNLELEIAENATFNDVKSAAMKTWNDLMNIVQVEGSSEEDKIELYSNMYRLYADPLTLSENTGTNANPEWTYATPYAAATTPVKTTTGYKLYYNNGFWDTYRGAWSAYQLLTPEYSTTLLNGLVQHGVDSGWLARWIAPGGRNSMVGTSSDIIFGDALEKGIKFDYENAYLTSLRDASVFAPNASTQETATYKLSFAGRAGMDTAPFNGFTTYTVDGNKGTSWALDNYLNDLGVSNLARKLGYKDEEIYFKNTALNYVNLWNYGNGGWFVGKTATGAWRYPDGLNYNASGSASVYDRGISDYEETNAFTMAWQAVQDVQGLINLYGGKDKFAARLDRFFTDETQFAGGGRDYVLDHYDSKMGQYGHSNQPDHHIPFMYTYAGQPYKTQALTREILDRVYTGYSFDQGFPGDADNGEQAGWYIMAAIGLYPFSTGTDGYVITSPMHDKTTLNLPTGKVEIIANNNSRENVYIQSMTIDGKPYDSVYITYADLIKAKKIVFEMGKNPSSWACDSVPPSMTAADDENVPNPLKDFTKSGVAIKAELPANNHQTPAAYATNIATTGTYGAPVLFNNTSAANANFTAPEASIYYYFPNQKKVEMYTITSGTVLNTSAPKEFALYGSNDGQTWDNLDSRTGQSFNWVRQTRPFAVDNDKAYNYYRLDLKADINITVSEIELMGYPIDIISVPQTFATVSDSPAFTFDIDVDNSVSSLWFRDDKDFGKITPTAMTSVVNADGTKTFSVTLNTKPGKTYVTALDSSGYEITASRKTINIQKGGLDLYKNSGQLIADYANATDAAITGRLIIGVYDSDNVLVDYKVENATIAASSEKTITLDGSSYKGDTVVAYFWNADSAPVCEPISIIN